MAHCVFYVCGHYICQNDFERLMQMEVADDSQVVTRLLCLPLHNSRVFMFGANRCTDVQFAARPLSPKQGELLVCSSWGRVSYRVCFLRAREWAAHKDESGATRFYNGNKHTWSDRRPPGCEKHCERDNPFHLPSTTNPSYTSREGVVQRRSPVLVQSNDWRKDGGEAGRLGFVVVELVDRRPPSHWPEHLYNMKAKQKPHSACGLRTQGPSWAGACGLFLN